MSQWIEVFYEVFFFLSFSLSLPQQEYYGDVLKSSSGLNTNACVTTAKPPAGFIREALKKVHHEVSDRSVLLFLTLRFFGWPPAGWTPGVLLHRYYGCGLVVPESLEGCRVLDLGSGSGRDVYMLSQLVGEKGHVTGIDMTEVQVLCVAVKSCPCAVNGSPSSKDNVLHVVVYSWKSLINMWTITWRSLASRSPMWILSTATLRPSQKRDWRRTPMILSCKYFFAVRLFFFYL